MPGKARSGPGLLTRWRAWLQGQADIPTSEEPEAKTTNPATRGDDVESPPPASLDQVLRDAAQRRGSQEGGTAGPTSN